METLFLYYFSFCAICIVALFVTRRRGTSGMEWQLTPEFVLVASFLVYTSAMPISRFVWRSDPTDLDVPFLQAHTFGALGLLVGLYFGKYVTPESPRRKYPIPPAPLSPFRCLTFGTAALLAVVFYVYHSVGMDVSNLLKPYTFERTVISEYSTLDMLIFPVAIATVLHCYLGAFPQRRRNRWLHRAVLYIALMISVLILIRGSRNLTVILWLPLCGIFLRNRRLPIGRTLAIAGSVFILYSTVAIIRSYGLEAAADSYSITLDGMDPALGELGTSYHVYSEFQRLSAGDELEYGKTYILGFASNLVPRTLWKDRPKSTAEKFSAMYYQNEDTLDGVGFSPVVEAMDNFSRIGIFPVFVLFAVLVVLTARYLQTKGRWGLLSYSIMLPMLVNWNRIDADASGKMFLVYVAFFWLLDPLIYGLRGRARALPVVAADRRWRIRYAIGGAGETTSSPKL